jgi:membrane protein insertase Oxa1/YidC/SpoIIIJ
LEERKSQPLYSAKLRDLAIQFTKMILILLFIFPVFTRNFPTGVVMKYKGGKYYGQEDKEKIPV